jgi:hypothetical protein
MNLDPLRNAATEAGGLFTSLLSSMSGTAGIWPGQNADGDTGLLMAALAGIAAAVTVALALTIYFQTGYRSFRDVIRHGLAATIGLGLLALAVYDIRFAGATSFDKVAATPATAFETQWRNTTDRAKALAAEMGQAREG